MQRFVSSGAWLRVFFVLLGSGFALSLAVLDGTVSALAVRSGALPGWAGWVLAAALVVVSVIGLGLVPATRSVEAAAAESLLGAQFPGGTPGPASDRSQRGRSLAWFAIHLLAGAVPVALVMFGLALDSIAPLVVLVVAAIVSLVVLGHALAAVAPDLLGPSQAERIEALEHDMHRATERNRLAREIHDSVGHALSLVTVQAVAARKVISRDPEFAASALGAIEEAARSATADLDHTLGLLREDSRSSAPAPDLGSLDALVAATVATGLELRSELSGDLAAVRPAIVGREVYRIVQEGLTNAVRYAQPRRATLTVREVAGTLHVAVTNPCEQRRPERSGRGLRGIEERTAALGGTVTSGVEHATWRLMVDIPVEQR